MSRHSRRRRTSSHRTLARTPPDAAAPHIHGARPAHRLALPPWSRPPPRPTPTCPVAPAAGCVPPRATVPMHRTADRPSVAPPVQIENRERRLRVISRQQSAISTQHLPFAYCPSSQDSPLRPTFEPHLRKTAHITGARGRIAKKRLPVLLLAILAALATRIGVQMLIDRADRPGMRDSGCRQADASSASRAGARPPASIGTARQPIAARPAREGIDWWSRHCRSGKSAPGRLRLPDGHATADDRQRANQRPHHTSAAGPSRQ